tara:strand:+ start:27 stop:641 length:615 start_codon:yes stop_codon:yes gene_type:complete
MYLKIIIQALILLTFLVISFSIYFIYFSGSQKTSNNTDNKVLIETEKLIEDDRLEAEENLLLDVNYQSTDKKGNIYKIFAKSGKISKNDENILILENVESTIVMKNKSEIKIYSDFAEYHTLIFDTKFRDNVKVKYNENFLVAQNADLMVSDKTISIYNNVSFQNQNVDTSADIVKYDIGSGKLVVEMFDKKDKIKILGKDGFN